MLHIEEENKTPYITQTLGENQDNIVIATTDNVKAYCEQVRAYVNGSYKVLGTDGFGRSDSRERARCQPGGSAHGLGPGRISVPAEQDGRDRETPGALSPMG